ncbi:MAG: Septum formation protein Maf [Ktedonobacterales bacterium]|jgi:MAF protein|nr:MAG: Septum formation protein Maf [Ktedonobacterales bacterium]
MSVSPLYLASASPRRRQLLTEAGIKFEQIIVPIDEECLTAQYHGPLERLGEYLARCKADAARKALDACGQQGLILASDTTVLLNDESLAKPRDLADAESMLRQLRGGEHVVATGVALAGPHLEQILSATSATRVLMRDYTDEEIATYVATGDPLDKAGAYSIQHPAFSPVESIVGCHLGVIGLPVCLVAALLGGVGVLPQRGTPSVQCPWSDACRPPFPTDKMFNLRR